MRRKRGITEIGLGEKGRIVEEKRKNSGRKEKIKVKEKSKERVGGIGDGDEGRKGKKEEQ